MLNALIVLTLTAWPLWATPPTGQIAYSTYGTIYVMNPDGTGRTRLRPGRQPAWSPDGERIVYLGAAGICVMERDGTGAQVILEDARGTAVTPCFSADGRQILFSWSESFETDRMLYVMDAVPGAEPHEVPLFAPTPGDPTLHLDPSWAPDGLAIAFVLARRSEYGTSHIGDIYVADPAGLGIRLLSGGVGQNAQPAWSPDSRTIAFYGRREDGEGIYLVGAEGADLLLLSLPWVIDWSPTWSPDGEWIAFSSSQSRESIDVFTMRRDGTDVTNLTRDSLEADEDPAWSPVALPPLETAVGPTAWGQLKRAGAGAR